MFTIETHYIVTRKTLKLVKFPITGKGLQRMMSLSVVTLFSVVGVKQVKPELTFG